MFDLEKKSRVSEGFKTPYTEQGKTIAEKHKILDFLFELFYKLLNRKI